MSQPSDSSKSTHMYPERRRKREQDRTEIFPTSKPQRTTANDERKDSSPVKKRQAVLSMNGGQLTTKRGLVNPQVSVDPRRAPLKEIAAETISLLPGLLATRPDVSTEGRLCNAADVLDPRYCPGLPSIKVRVISSDTIDAALGLPLSKYRKPCILNMANAISAGGGFKNGALAQEEALCYRTSLYRTLKIKHYPLGDREGIYSPDVMVIRESMKNGHGLVDLREPKHLAVISAVSVPAVCQPSIASTVSGAKTYSSDADRRLMIEKIRLILRMTIRHEHTQIVLGAFGCGAFGNPREEVANMFVKVLSEKEFQGGWWEDVLFAVLDDGRGPNFKVFHDALDGLVI